MRRDMGKLFREEIFQGENKPIGNAETFSADGDSTLCANSRALRYAVRFMREFFRFMRKPTSRQRR
jgi:hypothetical protein